jgi:hypothetical protein
VTFEINLESHLGEYFANLKICDECDISHVDETSSIERIMLGSSKKRVTKTQIS